MQGSAQIPEAWAAKPWRRLGQAQSLAPDFWSLSQAIKPWLHGCDSVDTLRCHHAPCIAFLKGQKIIIRGRAQLRVSMITLTPLIDVWQLLVLQLDVEAWTLNIECWHWNGGKLNSATFQHIFVIILTSFMNISHPPLKPWPMPELSLCWAWACYKAQLMMYWNLSPLKPSQSLGSQVELGKVFTLPHVFLWESNRNPIILIRILGILPYYDVNFCQPILCQMAGSQVFYS
jgi:hypothetical protein